jgi:CHASE3 domain sensor protein
MADAKAATSPRMELRSTHALRNSAFLIILALATVLFIVGIGNKVRGEEESLVALQALRAEIVTAQSGVRGFQLVGEPRFLEPYRDAVPAVRKSIADANAVMQEHERKRLLRMESIFAEWRRHFAEPTIAFVQQGRTEAAEALAKTGSGKRRIDLLKVLIADEIHEERVELDNARQLETFLGGVAIAGIAGLCLALALSGRSRWARSHHD